jgi:hypothetical protein
MTMRPEDCERRPCDVARMYNATEAERDTLQRKLSAMIAVVDSRGIQLDTLRAKLARAVEALRQIATIMETEPHDKRSALAVDEIAHVALAELEDKP